METPAQIQDRIIASFHEAGDAFNQFTYLLQLASEFPELPEERKVKDVLVEGCQSQVWLYVTVDDEGRIHIEGDSDTLMVRGTIRIFSLMFEGQRCEDVLGTEIRFVDETELASIFDSKRKAGVSAIWGVIERAASDHVRERGAS